MTDSLMFQEDDYVVLRNGQSEEIVSAATMLQELTEVLQTAAPELPRDVLNRSLAERPAYLLANYCELDLGGGQYLHWYAVRLEKN
jgi:Protein CHLORORESPIRATORY REDUCTION 7